MSMKTRPARDPHLTVEPTTQPAPLYSSKHLTA